MWEGFFKKGRSFKRINSHLQKVVIKLSRKPSLSDSDKEFLFHTSINLREDFKNPRGFNREEYFENPHEYYVNFVKKNPGYRFGERVDHPSPNQEEKRGEGIFRDQSAGPSPAPPTPDLRDELTTIPKIFQNNAQSTCFSS